MTAEKPPDGSNPRLRRGWWVAAGLLAGLLVVGLVVLWIQAPALYGRGDAAKTAAATTRGAILTIAAALIAATAAGAGLYMTARTLAETQRANREADQRDRYAKSIEQLGSGKLDIRLGGIYGLERIAETSERDQRTVVEVLRTFVSEHSRSRSSRAHRRPPHSSGWIATDVQAAIDVLRRLPGHPGLPQVQLDHAHLPHAGLVEANLTGAWLNEADLTDAQLSKATLAGAQLGGATLAGAQLGGATLTGARLVEADLAGARPVEATLTGARLGGANLTGTWLGGADLAGAWLNGANLTAVQKLTQRQLDSARGDEDTRLPDGLQRPAHWLVAGRQEPAW